MRNLKLELTEYSWQRYGGRDANDNDDDDDGGGGGGGDGVGGSKSTPSHQLRKRRLDCAFSSPFSLSLTSSHTIKLKWMTFSFKP